MIAVKVCLVFLTASCEKVLLKTTVGEPRIYKSVFFYHPGSSDVVKFAFNNASFDDEIIGLWLSMLVVQDSKGK